MSRRRNLAVKVQTVPPPPSWLRVGARRYWHAVAPALARKGLLTALTVEGLAMAAMWWDLWQRAVPHRAGAAGGRVIAEAADAFREWGRPLGLRSLFVVHDRRRAIVLASAERRGTRRSSPRRRR